MAVALFMHPNANETSDEMRRRGHWTAVSAHREKGIWQTKRTRLHRLNTHPFPSNSSHSTQIFFVGEDADPLADTYKTIERAMHSAVITYWTRKNENDGVRLRVYYVSMHPGVYGSLRYFEIQTPGITYLCGSGRHETPDGKKAQQNIYAVFQYLSDVHAIAIETVDIPIDTFRPMKLQLDRMLQHTAV